MQAEGTGKGADEDAGGAAAAAGEGGTADAEEAPVEKSEADALAEQVDPHCALSEGIMTYGHVRTRQQCRYSIKLKYVNNF